jgi:Uncharacterized protein conserved in bacteria
MICSFRGKHFFLSNFYTAPVYYNGLTYQNNEAAFQAQKTLDEKKRREFMNLQPEQAKRLGRQSKLRPDWENAKENIMYEICKAKFTQNADLAKELIATCSENLQEGNTWGDREWGTVNGVGENKLGKILMRIRGELN